MYEKELEVAREAARAAGALLAESFGGKLHVRKKGRVDLVTDADIQAEKLVMEMIRSNFPQDQILAEESGMQQSPSNRVWLIDPLDGTTNFAHAFPFFATSIGLEIDGAMVAGAVYNPVMGEYFEARRGGGASLNGSPIQVSATSDLTEALLATGFPYNLRENPELHVGRFEKMLLRAQGVRRPGSAAIDLCCVAAGRFDGFWEVGLKPWDTAAGILIVEEAGGRVTTLNGERFTPYAGSILAANPSLHGEMLSVLQ